MRINKHSRPWAMAGRRLFRERLKTQDTPGTISEAGNTLLEKKADTLNSPFASPQPLMNADPTQRLLTILGRFNRLVSLAEAGSAQDGWCDDCMEQLINGIEIAVTESWTDVKHALTDTARILQSYEDAGLPASALPFLKRSYEILCLMVGDLIVGNVRSGVIEKWRGSYAEAIVELRRAGIPLVDDGGGHQPASAATSAVTKPQLREPEPRDEPLKIAQEQVRAKIAAVPVVPENKGETIIAADNRTVDAAFDDLPFELPGEFESVSDASSSDGLYAGFQEEEFGVAGNVQAPAQTNDEAAARDQTVAEAEDAPLFESDLLGTEFDAQDEQLVVADSPRETEAAAEVDPVESDDAEFNSDCMLDAPPSVPDIVSVETMPDAAVESTLENSHAEMAVEQAAVLQPVSEPMAESEITTQGQPIAQETPENPIRALLRSVDAAIEKGDAGEAKFVALQLAAKMAALEEERAIERVNTASAALDALLAEIQEGEEVARQARLRLDENQETMRRHEAGIHETKSEIEGLQRKVAEVERRMADLDEQIRLLQEKRADEAQIGAELQADMEMAIYREGQMKEELARLRLGEDAARAALETAQLHLARLNESRERRESLIAEAEAEVARQHRSLAEIEHTINLVLGVVEEEASPAQPARPGAETIVQEPDAAADGDARETTEKAADAEIEAIADTDAVAHACEEEEPRTAAQDGEVSGDPRDSEVIAQDQSGGPAYASGAQVESTGVADGDSSESEDSEAEEGETWERGPYAWREETGNQSEREDETGRDGDEDNSEGYEDDYHRDMEAEYDGDEIGREDGFVSDWNQGGDELAQDEYEAEASGYRGQPLEGEQQELF